jgi:hypothetical protein
MRFINADFKPSGQSLSSSATSANKEPVLAPIEQTHILFINAEFKPFSAFNPR